MEGEDSIMKGKTLALLAAGSWLAFRAYRWATQYDLRGKAVLITGGSRGLGLVLARQLVDAGARVAICARDQAELDRAFHDLARRGGQVLAVPCDLTDRFQVQLLVNTVEQRFGRLDVLINNAGVISVGPMETMNLPDYEECMK